MSTEEFVFAPVHATMLTVVKEGDLIEDAITPACDFCLDTRVAWEYACEDFTLEVPGFPMDFASQGNWLACGHCAEMIEGGYLPNLTARSLRSWRLRNGERETDLDSIGIIQQGFFDHRTGARTPV